MKAIMFSVQTSLEQFSAQLRKNTDQSNGTNYRIMVYSEPQMFYGTVREAEFKVIPMIRGRNALTPVFKGKVENSGEGCTVSVKPHFSLISLVLHFGSLYMLIRAIIDILIYGYQAISPYYLLVSALAVAIFALISVIGSRPIINKVFIPRMRSVIKYAEGEDKI